MSTTLLTLRNEIYDALAEETDSTVYDSDFVDSLINQGHNTVTEQREFSFMETETLWTAALDTTLDGAITTASTTVDLAAATGWSATSPKGNFDVEGDVIAFTGVTSAQLTGVTGIGVGHADGVDAKPIYSVPSDMWKPTRLLVDETEVDYYDYRDDDRSTGYYIYNDFIYIPDQSDEEIVKLQYFKNPTTMDDDADTSEIPDKWVKLVIVPYVVGKALLYRDEQTKAAIYDAEFRMRLSDMVKSYGSRTIRFQSRIKSYK